MRRARSPSLFFSAVARAHLICRRIWRVSFVNLSGTLQIDSLGFGSGLSSWLAGGGECGRGRGSRV